LPLIINGIISAWQQNAQKQLHTAGMHNADLNFQYRTGAVLGRIKFIQLEAQPTLEKMFGKKSLHLHN